MVSSIASQQSLDCHLRSHVSEHLYEITCAYIQGVDPMLSLLWFPDPPSSSVSYTVQEGRSGSLVSLARKTSSIAPVLSVAIHMHDTENDGMGNFSPRFA